MTLPGEILELACCDRLTISPCLLAELAENYDPVTQKLLAASESEERPERLSESEYC